MDYTSWIKDAFGVEVQDYPTSRQVTQACVAAYHNTPAWEDEDDGIVTVGFAKTLCEEVARLTWLGTSVKVENKYLQETIDKSYYNLRTWGEYGFAHGTVIIKPNGKDYDVYLPDEYYVTDVFNREIWGAVIVDTIRDDDVWYTRLEWHRFDDMVYKVSNKCYRGNEKGGVTESVELAETPWSDLKGEVTIEWATKPLFAVLRTPQANPYDEDSPLGLPIVASAMQELEDLDVAYSRFREENRDSKRTVLMDSDRLLPVGEDVRDKKKRITNYSKARDAMGLPKYVKAVEGMGDADIYHEINPTLNTGVRLAGINALLSQIGYKVGFANGYFVFNEVSGIQTATGVEANQQRTIQFIKDCRDRAEKMLDDLLYAIAGFARLYGEQGDGTYKGATFNFGDITYNEDEDRARWLTYVSMGKVPFWWFLVKFEGFTEEEAKAIEQEAQPKVPDIFAGAEEE